MACITKRKLTLKEARVLVTAIKRCPNITGYTVNEWLSFQNVWVSEIKGNFAGVAVCEDVGKHWTFLVALFVLNKYRGQGIGKQLFNKQLHDIRRRRRGAFTASRNPIVISWIMEVGMIKTHRLREIPFEIIRYYLITFITPYRIKEYIRKSLSFRKLPRWVYARLDTK